MIIIIIINETHSPGKRNVSEGIRLMDDGIDEKRYCNTTNIAITITTANNNKDSIYIRGNRRN